MNSLRQGLFSSWLMLGLMLGLLGLPGVAVHAQASPGHAVVLLAGSNLPAPERAVLAGLLKSLSTELKAEDRIGVILYSDIVEHVSDLAVPAIDEAARIERVFDSLPAVDPLNFAVGIDRALELLSETPLQKSIIIIGELDVRLDDATLEGRYSRWLDGTLLPTAASEGIGLMVIQEQARRQGLLDRYGNDTFAQIAATEQGTAGLNALALQHVRTLVSTPSITTAGVDTPGPSSDTESALSPSTPATGILLNENTGELASAEPISPLPQQTASSGLLDRLGSLSMAPLLILAALMLGLIAAGLYYLFAIRQRGARGSRQMADPEQDPTEQSLAQPQNDAYSAYEVADDATQQATRSNQDDGESRFDALIDSLGGSEQETLPVPTRKPTELDDETIDTRTVDTRRPNRSTTTADMTRELEDLTRERSTQYDFE